MWDNSCRFFFFLAAKSCPTILQPPWTVACQALLSMGFPRQEYWSGLPFPSPEELSDSGIETESPALQADSLPLGDQGSPRIKPASLKLEGGFLTTGPPGKSLSCFLINTCILLLSNVLSKTPLTAQTLLELL